ncbi:MAG: type II secretion system protein [Firmicutes bacterium]|nr:type II secretion system protein [Bacillota bacterium]
MKKKGFTLTELLAVVVLIAVISLVGSYGVAGINRAIKKNMCESKRDLIISSAQKYGEDHLNKLTSTSKCTAYDNRTFCLQTTVEFLINQRYMPTSDRDSENKKIVINDLTEETINNELVFIYLDNSVVYAQVNDFCNE